MSESLNFQTLGARPPRARLRQRARQPPRVPALQLPQGAATHLLLPGGVGHRSHPPLQVWGKIEEEEEKEEAGNSWEGKTEEKCGMWLRDDVMMW